MNHDTSHNFAIFIDADAYSYTASTGSLHVTDHDTIVRIATVLRLKEGKMLTLFTHDTSYACTINALHKKKIDLICHEAHAIEPQLPALAIVLPLLDRPALEEVVYMATVYGVHDIHLITTEKSKRVLTEKEYARLHKIAIAAAEQSKQFFLPTIHPVLGLENFISKQLVSYKKSQKLWCDISGQPILKHKMLSSSQDGYLITWGPEGDFIQQEKELLNKFFIRVKLTHAVLRARDAASLIMGIIRL